MYKDKIYLAKNGIEVKYRHKNRKYDFDHVIFVFSGFMNRKIAIYDFENALNECPCDVIWIDDDFLGDFSYYLCKNMDFDIEHAVQEFIFEKIKELGVNKDKVTFTGFSKGGSAALYHAIKCDIDNIVITVPQMNIGNYIAENWPRVACHMMGQNYGSVNKRFLNNLILQSIRNDRKIYRNIYLLTSESDIQYATEIKPYLSDFDKYNNFNLIKTFSSFVREHNQVTAHHTALLLGIYYSLATELVPRYGNGKNNFYGAQLHENPKPSGEPYIDLRVAKIEQEKLFLEGISVLKGYNFDNYSDVSYSLILKGNRFTLEVPLAKDHKPRLTRDLFDGKYLSVYDKGNFTTYQRKGLDLVELKADIERENIKINKGWEDGKEKQSKEKMMKGGEFQLCIKIRLSIGVEKTIPLTSKKSLAESCNEICSIYQKDNYVYLRILENTNYVKTDC